MAIEPEKIEGAISFVARMLLSLVMPLWALAMLVAGAMYGSLWWAGCGVVVGAIGLILLAGNPLVWPLLRDLGGRR